MEDWLHKKIREERKEMGNRKGIPMKLTKLWLICTTFWLVGCMSMPADVTTYESKVDNIKHVDMKPGWLGDTMIGLGLHQSSDMKPGTVQFVVVVKSNTVSSKDGLTINVDGKKTNLSAIDELSDYDPNGFFRKRFAANTDLVKQMVSGKSVWVRVNYNGQTFQEGEFSKDKPMSAKRGFTAFLKEIGK